MFPLLYKVFLCLSYFCGWNFILFFCGTYLTILFLFLDHSLLCWFPGPVLGNHSWHAKGIIWDWTHIESLQGQHLTELSSPTFSYFIFLDYFHWLIALSSVLIFCLLKVVVFFSPTILVFWFASLFSLHLELFIKVSLLPFYFSF